MKGAKILAVSVLLSWIGWGSAAAESLVTVRFGEQDTCQVAGVTSIEPGKDGPGGVIRFNLDKLPEAAQVRKALLRMWVHLEGRSGRDFGVSRWDDPAFDGFKVWQVGGAAEPLAVSFPFAFTSLACHEWDVTPAVQAWAAKPASNKGLKTDFPLPPVDLQPAWQRPYLQVTYVGPNPNHPVQPKDLKAFYRCGQVFLTWKQTPYDGAFFDSTYRVYMHAEPITAGNLHRAELLGEVHKNSQLNYRRSAYSRDGLGSYAGYQHLAAIQGVTKTKDMTGKMYWDAVMAKIPTRYNFVIEDAWPQKIEGGKWLEDAKVLGYGLRELKGPELSDDTGLFVYTVAKAGKAHFAVTSVIEGNENRQDFSPANALTEPVQMELATPRPILQVAFHRMDEGYPHQKHEMREYAYWGGPGAGLAIDPSTPFYFRINPPGEFVGYGGRRGEAWLTVEPWWSHGGATVVVDGVYLPPTRLAPFPPTRVPFSSGGWKAADEYYYGGRKGPAAGLAWGHRSRLTNFYGYHDRMNTGQDPRQATVRPFLENRALRELEFFFQEFPQASRDRVRATGESKALLLAIHHPDVFAHCSAAQEEIWTSKRQAHQWGMVGKRQWRLKNDVNENAWDYNDPVWYSKRFPEQAWPFISQCMSPNYARGDQTHWGDSGYPAFYLAMAAERRGGQWWWVDIGDAPNGQWMPIPRNQAYLAFTSVNFCEKPQQEWRKEPRGSLNGYLTWHAPEMPFKAAKTPAGKTPEKLALPLDMVDAPGRFEVAVRIGDHGLIQNGQCVPPTTARFGACDITPWRLQQFKVEKGRKYLWSNRKVATGQLLQAGVVEADQRGLLTIPGFFVDRDPTGNKLSVEPAGGEKLPEVDETAKVGELSYAEYVQACRNPVLFPRVRPPSTKFTIAEFTYVGRGNPDGSVSFRGGSFGQAYDTIVQIEKAGPYVIAVRAKAQFGAAWPLMSLGLGGKYGRRMETKLVDTTEYASYCWYAPLEAGKLRVRLNAHADYYARPVLPALAEKWLHLADLTFTRMDEATAAKTAVEIRISPRQVTIPVGMPIHFQATVLNGLGEPMQAPVKWSLPGLKYAGRAPAEVDSEGRFKAFRPDDYLVVAEAAGIKGSAPITAGEVFTADFNHCGAFVPGWSSLDLSDRPGKWHPPGRGHQLLNSLWQHSDSVKSILLWDHGTFWTDCSIQADVFLTPRGRGEPFQLGKGQKVVHGLVIRAAGRDNHYRLEVERRDDGSEARLIRRLAGAETVLARTDSPPGLAPFDWQANPMCPGWHDLSQLHAEERGLHLWRMDRMKLQAVGATLRAWINGGEVFPEGVEDAQLKVGSAGLYAGSRAVFDNLQVRPAK